MTTNVDISELVHRGLVARDRLNYYVTLLQTADIQAQAPHYPPPTLRVEREASGIRDEVFDQIIADSWAVAKDIISIPGASVILKHIFADLNQMLLPLNAAALTRPEMRERLAIYQSRLDQQIALAPPCYHDQLTSAMIAGLAPHKTNGHDSVQQLTMDLHWELIQLNDALPLGSVAGVS